MTVASIRVPVAAVWSGPDAPRERDALAVADRPDVARWVTSLDGNGLRGLTGRAVTQALLGEPAELLDERDGWAEVVLPWQPSSAHPRGYRGWVRQTHLVGDRAEAPSEVDAVVTAPSVPAPDARDAFSYGTILPLVEAGADAVHLRHPDGAVVTVPTESVRVGPAPGTTAAALLASARQFLGLGYLWAGTCGWGMDCSGYVHLAWRVEGITVPRDAFDQAASARPRAVGTAGPGDLYFFARPGERVHHVGFATTRPPPASPAMLHAPESGAFVEEAPLTPDRVATLVSAGTFLS